MPLAFGQTREALSEDAHFGGDVKLRSIEFDWRKRSNAKIPSWDNTILGNIKISGHTMVAEVNSKNRADRLCKEIASRFGRSATLEELSATTVDDMFAKAPKRRRTQAKEDREWE